MRIAKRPATRAEDTEPARFRLGRVYDGYRASRRKRRAWAADNPGNVAIRAELIDRIAAVAGSDLESDGHVLDVGCGGGWLLHEFASRGMEPGRLHGIDALKWRIDTAAARLPASDIRLGDCRALPWRDGTFRLVTLTTVLSSLKGPGDVARAIGEVRRVIEPGGLVLIYEPRVPTPGNRRTRRVRMAEVERALGASSVRETLTLAPPLARRLGRLTATSYGRLSALKPLTTHVLAGWRIGADG